MKFTISRTDLLKALTLTGKALSTNNIMPALSCYQFVISDSTLTISANNLETFLSTRLPVKGDNGSALVPANKISFIKDLPEQPLSITISETFQIEVKYIGGKISFSGYDGRDFPTIKHESIGIQAVSSEDINESLYKTLYCLASDTLKPAWCGVTFEFDPSQIRITSLNGYIASTSRIEQECTEKKEVIIPKKSLEIFQGLPDDEGLQVSFGDNSIRFVSSEYELTSIIIDDQIPPVQGAIPGHTQFITIDRELLIGAIKRISQFSLYGEIILDIDNQLTIKGENSSMSEIGEEKLDMASNGKPARIGFKSDQLLPSLSKLTTEQVNIYYNTPKDAILLREDQNLLKENLILVRPINIVA